MENFIISIKRQPGQAKLGQATVDSSEVSSKVQAGSNLRQPLIFTVPTVSQPASCSAE